MAVVTFALIRKNMLTWIYTGSIAHKDLEFLIMFYYELITINAADQTK